MNTNILPEERFSNILHEIGVFDPDPITGDSYTEQLLEFNEDDLDKNERCIFIKSISEIGANSDFYRDYTILAVIVGKVGSNDLVNISTFSRELQEKLINTSYSCEAFAINNLGSSGNMIFPSGRRGVQVTFQMLSNY
jgi:hypothetical protein